MNNSLDALLKGLKQDGDYTFISREQFIEICNHTGIDIHDVQLFGALEEVFLQSIQDKDAVDSELYIKSKAWTVKLSSGILKSTIMGAILTGVFFASGYTMIPGFVLPAIIPLLFDIEKVNISAKEDFILAQLTLNNQILNKYKNPELIYDSLSEEITDELSKYDFIEFIEKMVLAGAFEQNKDSDVLIPLDGKTKFKINFL